MSRDDNQWLSFRRVERRDGELAKQQPLAVIDAESARNQIRYRDGYAKQHHAVAPEQLYGQKQRGRGAVCHPAKQRDEPDGGAERAWQPEHGRKHAPQRCADKEARHNLAAAKAAARVTAVSSALHKNAVGLALPASARLITLPPTPL